MAITNASTLAEYASGISTQGATLTVDANNKRVGIGTTNPQAMLQVGTGVTVFGNAGIASFTSLKLSGETDSTSTSTGALTVTGGVGIGLSLTVGGDVSVGGTITYEDVTNVDSIGIVTARSGLRVVGGGVTCVGVATFFNNIRAENGVHIVGGGLTCLGIGTFFNRVLVGTTTEGHSEADDLTVATSGHTGLTLRSGNSNRGNIYFSDGTSGDAEYDGWISYDHDTRALRLATATAEALRINSNGFVGIKTASPLAPLHVFNATNNTMARIESGDATCRLQLKDSAGEVYVVASGDNIILANTSSTTERLRIAADGRIILNDSSADPYPTRGLSVGMPANASGNNYVQIVASTTGVSGLTFADAAGQAAGSYAGMFEYYHSGDYLAYKQNASEKLRIDSSGRLLLGTTTEGYDDADDLTVATSGATGISIRSGTSSLGTIAFSDGTSGSDEYQGWVQYNHAGNSLSLGCGAGERVRIDGTGRLLVGVNTSSYAYSSVVIEGNATFSAGTGTLQLQLGGANPNSQGSGLGEIRFTDANESCGAIIKAESDAAWSNGSSYPAYLTFQTTAASATSSSEIMRITSDAKVKINIPSAKAGITTGALDVWGDGTSYPTLRLGNVDIDEVGEFIRFGRKDISSDIRYHSIYGRNSATEANNYIALKLHDGSGSPFTGQQEVVRITADGVWYINSPDSASGGRLYAASSAMYVQDGNGRSTVKVSDPGSGNSYTWELTSDGNWKAPAGKGIDFGAQTSSTATGATTNVEVLDHYEEGTWTPSFNESVSCTVSNASYVKIGKIVHLSAVVSSPNSTPSEILRITSLPFAAAHAQACGTMFGFDVNEQTFCTYINGSHQLFFYGINSGGAWTSLSWDDLVSGSHVYFDATYVANT